LGLTGRYAYFQMKAPTSSSPFSFHLDLALKDRATGVRISCSNLYKRLSSHNQFSLQVPINLSLNQWSVVVLDLVQLLKVSGLLPPEYMIAGSFKVKQIMLCACAVYRGIYTSDILYDFVTLPPEMRFKFNFEITKWPEQFTWTELPSAIEVGQAG
jgi:hypothetical protein